LALWVWVPGACFGLGTTVVQVPANGSFGLIARRRGLSGTSIRLRALRAAGKALTWGGSALMVGGTFGLALSSLAGFSITTGVHVQNLDHLGVALVLVVVSVVDVGASSLVRLAAPGRCGGSRGAAARCRPTLPSRAHVRTCASRRD
jgi:hypothetical protein